MREIKFRAFLQGIMCEVLEISFEGRQDILVKTPDGYQIREFLKNLDLMQYTGLRDINGKEIYEGDIVTTKNSKSAYIIYHPFFAKYCITKSFPFMESTDTIWDIPKQYLNSTYCREKVIGNIYENPELLENNK